MLACFHSKHVLLIKAKTDSNPDCEKLAQYREAVLSGKTDLGAVQSDDIYPIYVKTGNQSIAAEREIEAKSGYKVFTRRDFLDVLKTYPGHNAIAVDYRAYLEGMEEASQSFWDWRADEESTWWPAWE